MPHMSGPRIDAAVVCHTERLIAAAVAALLEERQVVRSTATTSSLTRLLSCLHRGVDVAVVFDGVDEDVSELFEAIRHGGLDTPVLLVSPVIDAGLVAQALEAGAAGMLPSSCSPELLCRSVIEARMGNAVVPTDIRAAVLEALRALRLRRHAARHRLSLLSGVDAHVLQALSDGLTVTEIARQMSLSPHTIRSHVRTLSDKLDVRGQLRIAAVGRSLIAAARCAE
jgi:DNA-binding NarL/FixJ family response regulator